MLASVVVTGADGFVGRHVTAALGAAGFTVIGASRRAGRPSLAMDVGARESVETFFRSLPAPDAVVHLAAIAHPRRDAATPADFDRVNHRGTQHVLDASARAGVRRVIVFSSAVVYGDDPGHHVPEGAAVNPVGAYARSKCDAEEACAAAIRGGADVVVLRFPVIYGREFLDDLRARAYVPFTGNRLALRVVGREPQFSLCSVANAADAVVHALGRGVPPGVYNVADARAYSQGEVRTAIAAIDGSRPAIAVPGPLAMAAARVVGIAGGPGRKVRTRVSKLFAGSTLDTSRIARSGFVPRHGLDGLTSIRTTMPQSTVA